VTSGTLAASASAATTPMADMGCARITCPISQSRGICRSYSSRVAAENGRNLGLAELI